MGDFSVSLSKWVEKVKDRADEVVGDVVVQIAASVDRRSPVGDATKWDRGFVEAAMDLGWIGEGYVGGRFRANWQIGVDRIPEQILDTVDPSGATTQNAIMASIPDEAAGKVYYLVNNLPYAQRLEEGYSKQAPTGMVGLAVIEFPQMVEQAVAGLK